MKKAQKTLCFLGFSKATLTGLEPATTGSTVRYSNQLSYSALFDGAEIIAKCHHLQHVSLSSRNSFFRLIFSAFYSNFWILVLYSAPKPLPVTISRRQKSKVLGKPLKTCFARIAPTNGTVDTAGLF